MPDRQARQRREVEKDLCGTIDLTSNPLSPPSLGLVTTLCAETKLGIIAEGALCEGDLPCPMP